MALAPILERQIRSPLLRHSRMTTYPLIQSSVDLVQSVVTVKLAHSKQRLAQEVSTTTVTLLCPTSVSRRSLTVLCALPAHTVLVPFLQQQAKVHQQTSVRLASTAMLNRLSKISTLHHQAHTPGRAPLYQPNAKLEHSTCSGTSLIPTPTGLISSQAPLWPHLST